MGIDVVEAQIKSNLNTSFTSYQKLVIAILAFLQFTVVLDFMILSPLGALLMPALAINPGQFGLVVSIYAFCAGFSGIVAAGFADRFDRKRMLIFFYTGFVFATFLCGIAPTYSFLIVARGLTGIFGGVIGSIVLAITTDIFPYQVRGRVLGIIQTAFSSSQILGVPIGLFLSNKLGWHAPFLMIVAVAALVAVLIVIYLQPIRSHLDGAALAEKINPIVHLFKTVSKPRYLQAFLATALLSIGGFMMMPFSSAFSVHNLGITLEKLPMVYMVTGICSMLAGPLIGRLSDSIGKFQMFLFGSLMTVVTVWIYTNLGVTPIETVILISVIMFIGILSRIITSSAMMSAIPNPKDRGAFMAVSSSLQQISGGAAASIGGMIIVQNPDGSLQHYNVLGFVVIGAISVTVVMMYFIHRYLKVLQKESGALGPASVITH